MTNTTHPICADCGGYDIEWMHRCFTHKGVEFCRGCECPYCAEEALYECDEPDDWSLDEHSLDVR